MHKLFFLVSVQIMNQEVACAKDKTRRNKRFVNALIGD